MDKCDWEQKMMEVQIRQAEAVSLMIDRGLEILRDSEASYKLSDGVRMIRLAGEIMAELRPKSEVERSLELLGMSRNAIDNGLVSSDRVALIHAKFQTLESELREFDVNRLGQNLDTEDDLAF